MSLSAARGRIKLQRRRERETVTARFSYERRNMLIQVILNVLLCNVPRLNQTLNMIKRLAADTGVRFVFLSGSVGSSKI